MRIGIHDNWLKKFSQVLIDYWESQGHTVLWEPGYNSEIIETCDRVFFESADTNAHLAAQQRPHKKGKVFVRIVDVDAWVNGPAGLREGYFDGIIYIAKHIQEHCSEKFKNLEGVPNQVIPMGIDLDKFNYKVRNKGHKIAFIATRLTEEKGFDEALKILAELRKRSNKYELHVVGRRPGDDLWEKTIDHIINENAMDEAVKFLGNLPYDTGNEINDFLEDKDYLLLPSRKEAFSFVTAEAMAKGIKPVVWNFYRAKDIWPEYILFNTHQEAVDMIDSEVYNSAAYRQWIEEKYPIEKHLERMNEFMEI